MLLSRKYIKTEYAEKLCLIKADDRFMYLATPDGKIIPGQLDLTIEQPFKTRGLAKVKITVFVKFENLITK